MNKKLGLVLDGGGAKGAYQIGIWKALRETGLERYISCISGTSVGGLNAALFLQGDLDKAENIWRTKLSDLQGLGKFRLQIVLEKLIEDPDIVDMSVFQSSKIECYMTAYNCDWFPDLSSKFEYKNSHISRYSEGRVTYFNMRYNSESESKMILKNCSVNKKIMYATSALPILCKKRRIDGVKYRDGGVKGGDNSPAKPLAFGEKCETVIVVHLDGVKDIIDKSQYPDTQILEIVPSQDLGWIFKGTMNFSTKKIERLIKKGFEDSFDIFKKHKDIMDREREKNEFRILKGKNYEKQVHLDQEIKALIAQNGSDNI